MISGIGVDCSSVDRIAHLGEGVIKRILSASELEDLSHITHERSKAEFIASRFAVKEAYAKARGTGFCSFVVPTEISLKKEKSGRPYIELSGITAEHAPGASVLVSLTHEENIACAVVVLEDMTGVEK